MPNRESRPASWKTSSTSARWCWDSWSPRRATRRPRRCRGRRSPRPYCPARRWPKKPCKANSSAPWPETAARTGQAAAVTFVLAWHFPNLKLKEVKDGGRHYAARFSSAADVAAYLAGNLDRLSRQTRLWHDTWYDSTLPYWFLDRTFANTSTLATSTCHRFKTGRFYGWEGVGCCEGTCTHVWHYAQAVARLFPELERDLRRRTDFGTAIDPARGVIRYRGERDGMAVDGQAGCILRAYREHQMSASDAFLKAIWPKVKLAMLALVRMDGGKGLIEGSQWNTLDAAWFGEIAWLSGMYVAALRR